MASATVPNSQLSLNGPQARCCDAIIEATLIGLFVFMPFALGVVAPWSELIVVALAGFVAFLLVARAWFSRAVSYLSWALIPVALFLLAAAFQLLRVPAAFAGAVSPNTLFIKTQLLGDLPNAENILNWITLTFYPAATRHDLRRVLVCTLVLLATLLVVRREEQIRRLLWAIAITGGAVATLALLQDFSQTDKIYWLFPSPRGVANSGPFVGYSNYSEYINLSTGASFGLLLYYTHQTVPSFQRLPGRHRGTARPDPSSPSKMAPQGFKTWRPWVLITFAALGTVTLFLSTSRGGMLSMLCAAGFTGLMLARRSGMRGALWLLLLVLLVIFVGLLYLGFDAICDRLATLRTAKDPSAGRFQIDQGIIDAWKKFPVLGTGLGTHEYVYPMFDRSSDPRLSEYADSDWFQLLEEMGTVGVALVMSFTAFAWLSYGKAVSAGRPPINVVAYGLGFGLMAVLLQSWTDFGQHLPAIGCLSALFCGLLFHLARDQRSGKERSVVPRPNESNSGADPRPLASMALWRGRRPQLAISVVMAAALTWAMVGAVGTERAEAATDRAAGALARLDATNWRDGLQNEQDLLAQARSGIDAVPDDVKAHYRLGCYKWQIILKHAAAPEDASSRGVVLSDDAVQKSRQLVADLNRSRPLCPTFGPTYAVAGQIERLVLDDPIGSSHVRTAYTLAPADPQVCFAATQLEVAEKEFDESLRHARRCVALDPSYLWQVVDLYIHHADRPDLAVAAAGDVPQQILEVYSSLRDENDAETRPSLVAAMSKARGLLDAAGDQGDASAWLLVSLAGLLTEEKKYEPAIALYRRALHKEYGHADWHLNLANLLAQVGQNREAIHEAQVCMHLNPQAQGARELILELNTRPGIADLQGSASGQLRTGE